MPALDPRIDAYIAQAPAFAQPILTHLREVVHAACPQVEETMKWSRPHFEYKGLLCGMSAFKAHCGFGFWKGALMFPDSTDAAAAGNFGRITALSDLPTNKALTTFIKQAMKLNEGDATAPPTPRPTGTAKPPLVVPDYFRAALKQNAAALQHFDAASTSYRREYVSWLDEAKTDATRDRRMAQAIEWIAEGKGRNWKYEQC